VSGERLMARSCKRFWPSGSVVALLASAGLFGQEGNRAADDASAASGAADDAAGAELDRDSTRCIVTTRLDRTEVVDDQTVLFFMRGGDVYRNRLTRSCPGLEREKRFTYRVYGNQLCRIDTITVLESRAFGLTDGFTCALGDFQPISVDEAERLTGEFWPRDVEIEAVELPEEDKDASGDQAADRDDAAEPGAKPEEPRKGESGGERP
jgi:hypothetical protein